MKNTRIVTLTWFQDNVRDWTWAGDAMGRTVNHYGTKKRAVSSHVYAHERFEIFLKQDNTIWGKGCNACGQLGASPYQCSYYESPTQIMGIDNVRCVAAGDAHSLALKKDGTVWAWGDNYHGQLGDESKERRLSPVRVEGLADVIAIAAGGRHSLALKKDGTVWAWGNNTRGQLGNGSKERRLSPVRVIGLADVTAVVCTRDYSLALKKDGTVWGWGENSWGELGRKRTRFSVKPIRIQILKEIIALTISEKEDCSLALKKDGTVWAWGCGMYGEGNRVPARVTVGANE